MAEGNGGEGILDREGNQTLIKLFLQKSKVSKVPEDSIRIVWEGEKDGSRGLLGKGWAKESRPKIRD